MQKTENRIMKKGHDISSLLSAGGHRGPETFMPFIAHVASSALRHDSVHHQCTDILLGLIIRRGNRRIINEKEIAFTMLLKTPGQCNRLVVLRNESLNCFLDRFFVTIHQSFETDFRQSVLPMNRPKHLFDILQQAFAVDFRGIKRRQKLDFTNQVCPAKLKKRFVLFSVLQIRTEKITAETSGKIFTKRFNQNLAAPRGVNLEERKTFRDETPRPLQLAVLFETRLINVKMILLFQKFFKFLVRRLERGRHFFDLFDEKTRRKINPDAIAKIFLERPIRNMTPTFEIGGEGDHVRTEQSCLFRMNYEF